ncbi:hypothetical protein [Helicobacter pylori]|uniref:hypothetical protein n=1 Tax=Helicobacter pylori TaxID=210 RepID=UPI000D36FDFC|nr:hypothetical protein [Helicobacter pylori]PUD24671.1 hypothetical protein C2S30_01110 [Helicobacter pylori]
MGLLSFRIKLRSFDFGVLIFRAFREILKRLKGNIPKHPLVNKTLETHLAKTEGFVFHTHHP